MSENSQANPSRNSEPNESPRGQAGPSFFFPLLLIVVGVVLMLNTTGMLPRFAWWRLWVLWPAFLILIGVDILLRRTPALLRLLAALVVVAVLVGAAYLLVLPGSESARPLQAVFERGAVQQGDVRIDLGVGQLTMEPLGDTPNWVEVDLTGPAQEPIVSRLDETARLDLSQGNWTGLWGEESRWVVRVHPRVPTAVKVHVGVGQCTLNLGRLHVTRLEVDTGVAECTVSLPAGESGTVRVTIDGGVGALHVVVPEGVAAQVRLDPGIGGVRVDTQRFPKVGDDLYRSANYETAAYKLDLTVDLGIGAIDVK